MRNQIDTFYSYLRDEIPDFRIYAANYLATHFEDQQDRKTIENILTCLENAEFKCRHFPNESDKIYNDILIMFNYIITDALQDMLIEEYADAYTALG